MKLVAAWTSSCSNAVSYLHPLKKPKYSLTVKNSWCCLPLKTLKLILDTFSMQHLYLKTAITRKKFGLFLSPFFWRGGTVYVCGSVCVCWFVWFCFHFCFLFKQDCFPFQFSDVSKWSVRRSNKIKIDVFFLVLLEASFCCSHQVYVLTYMKKKTGRHICEHMHLHFEMQHTRQELLHCFRKKKKFSCLTHLLTSQPTFLALKKNK